MASAAVPLAACSPATQAALESIGAFLRVPTPERWIEWALGNVDVLLIDHANCEKKAASTALALLYRPATDVPLAHQLSRLAREELRHYEQVLEVLTARGVALRPLSPSRYAAALRAQVTKAEPQRLIDTFLVSAIVEARSCERFACLVDRLEPPLAGFYQKLLASEARHFEIYLEAARTAAAAVGQSALLAARLDALLTTEAELVIAPDSELRFHSGPPAPEVLAQRQTEQAR